MKMIVTFILAKEPMGPHDIICLLKARRVRWKIKKTLNIVILMWIGH